MTLPSGLPNALTILRLAIAGAFPLAPDPWRLPLALVGFASDAIDGPLARWTDSTSWTGALMDGIADKLLALSILVTLTLDGLLGPWQLAGLLARDITNAVITIYVLGAGRSDLFKRVAARVAGKAATVAIFGAVLVLLWDPDLAPWLVWVGIALSVAAALDYAVVFARWAVWGIEPAGAPPPPDPGETGAS